MHSYPEACLRKYVTFGNIMISLIDDVNYWKTSIAYDKCKSGQFGSDLLLYPPQTL